VALKQKDGSSSAYPRPFAPWVVRGFAMLLETVLHQRYLLAGLSLVAQYPTLTASVGTGAADDRAGLHGKGVRCLSCLRQARESASRAVETDNPCYLYPARHRSLRFPVGPIASG
jgi:hypothetical protein